MNDHLTNRLLGYPPDARLLIINADDFGLCNATNEAIIGSLGAGLVQSTSLMVPCPWALQAMHFLADHPEVPFGVHITVLSDAFEYRWGPLSAREKVPSLLDAAGYFNDFAGMPGFLARVNLDELELEFRAQIERVLAAGLHPAHLDWHSLRIDNRVDIFDLMARLAREYGLALRVRGQIIIARLQSQGFPTIDYDFLDSYLLDPARKPELFAQQLRELPAGLSEWAIHPGFANAELLALEPTGARYRQADYDFLTSAWAKELIQAEGIILLDYRALQAIWRAL